MDKNKLIHCKKLIEEADSILIGAGSGLSTAAGLKYSGSRFTDNFLDFIEKYKLTDMYTSAFYPFDSEEERWAYFSRHIKLNRFDAKPGKVYLDLLEIVKNKNYFVITTNVDGQFEKSGFDKERIFATQGDYGLLQCQEPCHDKLYDNSEIVFKMVRDQKNCKIPSELIPYCPVCGKLLVPHLRKDSSFLENEEWVQNSKKYSDFINENREKRLLLLEFGIGFNTPGIIRIPFEKFVTSLPNSTLIRVNLDNVEPIINLPESCLLLKENISDFMEGLKLV